jgi:cysteine synthase A
VTVLPDRGDRYLDQVYDDDWVDRLPATDAVTAAS